MIREGTAATPSTFNPFQGIIRASLLSSANLPAAMGGTKTTPFNYLEKKHDQRTEKQKGRKEKASHDPKRKEGCEKVQKGA